MNIPEIHQDDCARFCKVVSARRRESELLELFQKLEASEKFSEPAKPYCFAILLDAVIDKLKVESLPQLYTVMAQTDTADVMRSVLTQDEYETVFAKVVRKALESVPVDPSLVPVCHGIERSNIARSLGETISIAIFSGMNHDTLDDICDVLHEHYYSERLVQEILAKKQIEKLESHPAVAEVAF